MKAGYMGCRSLYPLPRVR